MCTYIYSEYSVALSAAILFITCTFGYSTISLPRRLLGCVSRLRYSGTTAVAGEILGTEHDAASLRSHGAVGPRAWHQP